MSKAKETLDILESTLTFEDLPEEIKKSFEDAKFAYAIDTIEQGKPMLLITLDTKTIHRDQLNILLRVKRLQNINIQGSKLVLIYR